jgi:hypothetical protein
VNENMESLKIFYLLILWHTSRRSCQGTRIFELPWEVLFTCWPACCCNVKPDLLISGLVIGDATNWPNIWSDGIDSKTSLQSGHISQCATVVAPPTSFFWKHVNVMGYRRKMLNQPKKLNALSTKVSLQFFSLSLPFAPFIFFKTNWVIHRYVLYS